MNAITTLASAAAVLLIAGGAGAGTIVIDYEDLTEGPQGDPLMHMGVTYHDLNTVSGVFPSGETFEPAPDDEFIVENAGLLYADFPGYGSPVNALTFGIAWVPGDNLSIGGLSNVTMDLGGVVTSASFDLAYYENGVWGGIEFHLDALDGGSVVASDSFVISDLGGRDNVAVTTLEVSGADFDQLVFYATYGDEYSKPRAMIDDLTLVYADATPVQETSWGRIKDTYGK